MKLNTHILMALIMVCGLWACDTTDASKHEPQPELQKDYGYPMDDVLRVNHIQAKGTHNSYHIQSSDPADDSHRYTMPTLTEQLGTYGIRQLELDLHYSAAEGYQVFHIPTIDALTTCRLFAACLQEIKDWSDANPGHHMLFVWIEIKDMLDADKIDDWDDFDAAIRSVWPADRLFTPDDLQGSYGSLREALTQAGWPTLGATRDQIMFMLNNTELSEDYSEGGTSLAGRVMFINAGVDHDLTAIWKHGSEAEQQAALDHKYLLGDNGGGAGSTDAEAAAEVSAAWARGVNFLASDFPAPVTTQDFVLTLPGGKPSVCNPKTAPADCSAAAVEDLPRSLR